MNQLPQLREGQSAPYSHVRLLEFRKSGIDKEQRTVEGWASTPEIDSYQDIVLPTAFTRSLPAYMRNPVMYWNHFWYDIPVAKCLDATIHANDGLWVKVKIGTTTLAQEVWTAVAIDETVKSMSIGFNGDYTPEYGYFDNQKDAWIWQDLDLREISIVGMPACPSAQFQLSKSMNQSLPGSWRSTLMLGGELPLSGNTQDWTAVEARKRLRDYANGDWHVLAKGFLWRDPAQLENPSAYRLPIADVVNGELAVTWEGCAAACAVVLGARAGGDIPEADRQVCYRNLKTYYQKFGKTLPEFAGDWPTGLSQVRFANGELDILEEQIAIETAETLVASSRSLANIRRHWEKSGRGQSARVNAAVSRSMEALTQLQGAPDESGEANPRRVLRLTPGANQQKVLNIRRTET
jgi:HK97 family phage prohead protease